jgi:hypothetical protein
MDFKFIGCVGMVIMVESNILYVCGIFCNEMASIYDSEIEIGK